MADIHLVGPRHTLESMEARERIVEQRPRNGAEALVCIQRQLERFYRARDNRAFFLRAYYIMTAEVTSAIRGEGDFDKPIFFDPRWVDGLIGGFARLYFDSLKKPACKAWELAHELASQRRSSILQNLLLGINAHINYDLAISAYEFIPHQDSQLLARRKFDHDQINNVLMRSMPKIQRTLAREFGGAIRFLSGLFGKMDEFIGLAGLRYYRDRVWNNVLAFLSAKDESEREKVRMRLNWESLQVAEVISDGGLLNHGIWNLDRLLRRWRFEQPMLETAGSIHARGPLAHRLQRPF